MTSNDVEAIKTANIPKTATMLTSNWADILNKYLLNDTETFSEDPASGINLFLHLSAQGAAKMMYEQNVRIRELHENTAILPKSLIGKLSADELAGIYGIPSTTSVVLAFKEDDIKRLAVQDPNSSDTRRLVINKNMTLEFDGHPAFKLPYDVSITIKTVEIVEQDPVLGNTLKTIENIYATYELPSYNSGITGIYNINSPNIISRQIRYEGSPYIAFFVSVYQIVSTEHVFLISNPDTSDFKITFTDSLVGFEVFKKGSKESDYSLLTVGLPEGQMINSGLGYNYSYDYKQSKNNLNIIFTKSTTPVVATGDSIKIIVYTTKGTEGNIEFPNMIDNINKLIINLGQDLNIENQNRLTELTLLAFTKDSKSINGRNQYTLEELRTYIINKKYMSNNILITNNEIINKGKELGLDCYKIRHDIVSMYYRGTNSLVLDNMILSSGMNDFKFTLDQNGKDATGFNFIQPTYQNPNLRIIEPTHTFKYDSNTNSFYLLDSLNEGSYKDYVDLYKNAIDPEKELQSKFPFHIAYENTKYPSVKVYDMSMDETYFLKYTSFNEDVTLDQMDISVIRVVRNPLLIEADDNSDINKGPIKLAKNRYYFYFNVYTSSNSLNYIQSQMPKYENDKGIINDPSNPNRYMYFRIKINEINSVGVSYEVPLENIQVMSIDRTSSSIMVRAFIETDNYISDDKRINITSLKNINSVLDANSSNILIDTTVSLQIEGMFNGMNNSPSITYTTDDIELVKYRTDDFGIDFDINTSNLRYETYDSDELEVYEDDVFAPNNSYDPTILDKTDPNFYKVKVETEVVGNKTVVVFVDEKPVYIYIHKKGDSILDDNGNQIYIHKKGDPVLDDNGNYIPKAFSYIGILKNISWLNRLYFNSQMYQTIANLYVDLINKIDQIRSVLFEGGIIFAGLKTTSGHSEKYKAVNLNTGNTENLLNLALSLEYKVKFVENVSIDYKKEQITNSTIKYIENLGSNDFSMDNLFEYIKQNVNGISYINLTKLNQYKNASVQTILNDPEIQNEVLTISQIVDISNSNVDNGSLIFKPDITIKVIGIDDV